MDEANQLACPTNNQRLTQAVADFIYNVEHSNVAGWGDCSTDVRADASFKELKAALAEAGGQQPAASEPPDVSTSASANGSEASNRLLAATGALMEIVEGVRNARWSHEGKRLVDTPEWCELYCAWNAAKAKPLNEKVQV